MAYKGKLGQAEVAVKSARNNLPCPLRVHSHWDSGTPARLPTYPDVFTRVCSRWRRIALASHTLWSHIDIRLSCNLSKGFHARAETYVARAHQAPLEIHFIDSSCIVKIERSEEYDDDFEEESFDGWFKWEREVRYYNPEVFAFLAATPRPRIRSLGLLVFEEYHAIHSRALEHCLANCFPGILSELVIDVPERIPHHPFFQTSLDPQHRDDVSSTRFLSLSEQQLEDVWRSTTTLFLRSKSPRWSSAAYHGLIDLRLFGRQEISELELTDILTSSPGLRILRCNFDVHGSTPLSDLVPSVVLQELEVLNLEGMNKVNTECFLGWLKPGLKPLRLSLSGDSTLALLDDFYARSNVQEMRVKAEHQYFDEHLLPFALLSLPPQLRTLVMVDRGQGISYRIETTYTSPPIKLDTLYMLSCRYDKFSELGDMVAKYSPRRLVLWECSIGHPYQGSSKIDMRFLESAPGNTLRQFCVSIECPTDWNYSSFLDWDS
ncbi:hypothetical protein ACGC1H_002213 [Rhizoctonia solani]